MSKKIIALLAAGLLLMSMVAPASAAATKVTYCHLNGTMNGNGMDNWTDVTVSGGAILTHDCHPSDFVMVEADGTVLATDCPPTS